MFRSFSTALLAGACVFYCGVDRAAAQGFQQPTVIYSGPPQQTAPVRTAYVDRSRMGGGFIEFLFGDPQGVRGAPPPQQPMYQQQPSTYGTQPAMPGTAPQQGYPDEEAYEQTQRPLDPKYEKQVVDYDGKERPGTIVIDTPNKFLYLVQGQGTALRYGIGVGRPGFTWSGVKTISAKREWPDWTPPPEMLQRRPDLPRHMEGGPQNPLGARAMYLGSSLYRIHGSNEPWTIGTNVSSGCIRMRNEDVIDLYGRVNVGARVIVM
ncbi:putative ErfK/YbiS/YcfS/YnhG protein family [Bradyrhizobium sp. ORS 285]|uniref:L,D-transpeptidase n=1 Tax=Bradyrhizobium sp. ORS 285 TaxID=115808 RepID=UPI0002407E31|nr:L,D-transpeptidase [Bradyrhizobium sp. ORS 285]CCD85031.1 putative ErfK/YbiS/YcfS/YnhG protein family [Bradyrhizobium sp. ORS 285]SMX60849.1 putative ErfK/YbiS/YcfS/YnhG protein family [Bradyrhizobium sp. ORS 285]